MDSICFENVKAEKAKALHRFQGIGLLFRVTEICLALLFLCWIFSSLPLAAARISGEFLRRLACIVSSPLFMFVLGNSIVVALLATKSTVFSSAGGVDGGGGGGGGEADIYDLFIRSGENRATVRDVPEEETAVYDDKQMIDIETDSTNSIPTVAREDHVTIEPEKESVTVTDLTNDHPPIPPTTTKKVYRRSKSEKQRRPQHTVTKPSLLRRSETEKCRETVEPCEEEVPFPEDTLTNEEFQKTIEAFIAKQLIFRRRESLAVVIP